MVNPGPTETATPSGAPPPVDYMRYLEAVSQASQRSRSTLYVLVVALLTIYAAYRNTWSPDWMDARLAQLQKGYACLLAGDTKSPGCPEAIEYSQAFLYYSPSANAPPMPEIKPARPGVPDPVNDRLLAQLGSQIEVLVSRRSLALTLQLPFFGLSMDMNDLGIIGGFALLAILSILSTCLGRELRNLRWARDKALHSGVMENLAVLLMAQSVTATYARRNFSQHLTNVVFLLPPWMLFYVIFSDLQSSHTSTLLIGWWNYLLTIVLQWIAFVAVVWLCYRCLHKQVEINQELDHITDLLVPYQDNELPFITI